jgi:hypothetical protein
MKDNKVFKVILTLFVLLCVIGAGWQLAVAANQSLQRKEVKIDYGEDKDIWISTSGVYFANSPYRGTVVLDRIEHPPNYGRYWHVWTQKLLDLHVFDEETGKEFTRVYGAIQVYFNLDVLQRQKWDDKDSNMSIWYFDEFNGLWVKCPTFIIRSPAAPRGRLACYAIGFGNYGVGWTQPVLEINMDKDK